MRWVFAHVVPWLAVLAIGWMAGDRYGAPAWMSGPANSAFTSLESAASGVFGDLFERVSEPIPADADRDGPDAGAQKAGEARDADERASASIPAPASPSGGIPENRDLRINDAGLQIIKDSEGLRLEPYAAGGYSYIGYGHQIQPGENFTSLTEAEAEALLRSDIAFFENGVRESLARPATQNQFSAMVSLAYNKGLYGFRDTDVLRLFNAGDVAGAADDFRNHTGRGSAVPHLVERRERERMLFLK